jgi:hypothetical protein
MNAIFPFLIIVLVLAAGALVVLALVIAGIHGDERHMSLGDAPHTCAGVLARRVLGVHGSRAITGRSTRGRTRR